jgi:hypothetical protein
MCVFGNHTDTGGPHLLPLTTPFTTCLGVTPRAVSCFRLHRSTDAAEGSEGFAGSDPRNPTMMTVRQDPGKRREQISRS